MLINGFDVRVGASVTPLTTENTPRYKEDAPARKNLSDYFYLSIYLFIYLSIYFFIYIGGRNSLWRPYASINYFTSASSHH